MMDDPLSRLFEMHLAHGTCQLKLARKLLELRTAETALRAFDGKLVKGGLDTAEQEDAETRFGAADDLVLKLRGEIKKLVEDLTGVPFGSIEEANL